MRRILPILVAATSLLFGCGDDDDDRRTAADAAVRFDAGPIEPTPDMAGGGGLCTGDERVARLIFYGTEEPTYVPLSSGQVQSVVSFGGCSGMLITDEWVLTARHCGVRTGDRLCIGVSPTVSDVCFTAAQAVNEPGGDDLTLVRLDAPASSRAAWAEPVPILTEVMDSTWIGETAEAAGFGQQEDGSSGEREFTAEPIAALRGSTVSIDGMGERGVCFGDSGGPLFVIARDGSVRVTGALSGGDESCVGVDNFARVDVHRDWVESYTGPTVVEGATCGSLTAEGRCQSGAAVYCAGEVLARDECGAGTYCGWDPGVAGYRCVAGTDPCGGVDSIGECDGTVARWCERGELRSRDCGACGEVCANVAAVGGYYCQADPCDGLDYLGRCNGDVAEWCDGGEFRSRNCAESGGRCGYIDDRIGYFCSR